MDFLGTPGPDTYVGTASAETFNMKQGGDDDVFGRGGNDQFQFGTTLDRHDHINGGKGGDLLTIGGGGNVFFGPRTIVGVEAVDLNAGFDYSLHFVGGAASVREGVFIDGSSLSLNHTLTIDAHQETRRQFAMIGGAGDDKFTGSQNADAFAGGFGRDVMDGQGGRDQFNYNDVHDSTGIRFDTILFDVNEDYFGMGVDGIDAVVSGGTLNGHSDGKFNASLERAIGHHEMRANHAVLFQPDHGDWAGRNFFIIDVNGHAGYQAGEDLVIQLHGTHLVQIGLGNFLV